MLQSLWGWTGKAQMPQNLLVEGVGGCLLVETREIMVAVAQVAQGRWCCLSNAFDLIEKH